MPEISRFFGIIITMYYNDHGLPHFHAKYGEHKAKILIETGAIVEGGLPRLHRGWSRNGVRNGKTICCVSGNRSWIVSRTSESNHWSECHAATHR